jgi:hypothetical protein
LKRISEVSPHRGTKPRGTHPDGKSYYKDSALDQHTLYLFGEFPGVDRAMLGHKRIWGWS